MYLKTEYIKQTFLCGNNDDDSFLCGIGENRLLVKGHTSVNNNKPRQSVHA